MKYFIKSSLVILVLGFFLLSCGNPTTFKESNRTIQKASADGQVSVADGKGETSLKNEAAPSTNTSSKASLADKPVVKLKIGQEAETQNVVTSLNINQTAKVTIYKTFDSYITCPKERYVVEDVCPVCQYDEYGTPYPANCIPNNTSKQFSSLPIRKELTKCIDGKMKAEITSFDENKTYYLNNCTKTQADLYCKKMGFRSATGFTSITPTWSDAILGYDLYQPGCSFSEKDGAITVTYDLGGYNYCDEWGNCSSSYSQIKDICNNIGCEGEFTAVQAAEVERKAAEEQERIRKEQEEAERLKQLQEQVSTWGW